MCSVSVYIVENFIQERHAVRYQEGQLNIQINSNGIDCLTLFGSVERCVCVCVCVWCLTLFGSVEWCVCVCVCVFSGIDCLTLFGSVVKSTFSELGLALVGFSSLSPLGQNCNVRLVPVETNVWWDRHI